jgi:hypothetical protein
MLRKSVIAAATGTVILLGAGVAQAGPVVVDSWSLVTGAADYVGDNRFVNSVAETAVQLPFSHTTTRSYGQSICTNTYSFEVSEAGATFAFDFDHIRGGHGPIPQNPEGSSAYSWGRIYFHVTAPVTYSISGEYAMSGTNGLFIGGALMGPQQVELFANNQASFFVPDEGFTLGQTDGTDYNYLAGSLSGTLQPGDDYVLGYNYDLRATATDSGASALGWFRFTVTPEPTSVLLAAAVLVTACSARHGRKRYL